MKRYEGLTVIVTGAGGGFGKRLAERLAEQGANLVLSDIRQPELNAVAGPLGERAATLSGDVSKEEHSRDLVNLALKRFGKLDVAFNNAGIAHAFSKLPSMDSEEARRVIDIDLMGVFYAMKHQLPALERQYRLDGTKGAIVNVASVAGIAGAPRLAVYSAAKHGVVGLTRSAAAEYASKGIRINAVCPSYARTPMATDALGAIGEDAASAEKDLVRGVPMRRLAEVDEVIEVMLFAGEPNNSFMTGQTLAVDGGITAI
ncbi:SDR family NAD(P)-dependent oxidoreductase [Aliihoeflea sp. 40Bstr573]|uniref:SDR family NAD(P)-dependent oxidoreductase n=1 Tax=Aliihoeflea sp. 40Bstr573 TaxID=2696467 RepID=UPI002095AA9A|nr:SDR family NAD(P)-dependent oxidoreductase [Aliihoeflea sp. 40Bstr573]MCO6386508.1 glucose 1-dehydrogenase [Aliihoeflea sp. 40Bstr573]